MTPDYNPYVREQAYMIENLQSTIDTLNASIANLHETIEDLRTVAPQSGICVHNCDGHV